MRFFAVVTLGLMGLLSAAQGATLSGQYTAPAGSGETEEVVCDRAREAVEASLRERMEQDLQRTAEFARLHQAWIKRRLERPALDAALQDELQVQFLFTETKRFWSGKRCFIQGFGEVDESRLWAALQSGLPPKPEHEESATGASDWLDAVPSFFTNAQAFNTAMAELTFLKAMLAEHYHMEGKWPTTLTELRLSANDMETFEAVDVVTLDAGGEIVAVLAGGLEGEEIRLKPRVTGHLIRWHCATTLNSWAARGCQ